MQNSPGRNIELVRGPFFLFFPPIVVDIAVASRMSWQIRSLVKTRLPKGSLQPSTQVNSPSCTNRNKITRLFYTSN